MKKVLILLCFLCLSLPVFSASKMLHYYPATSVYYYYAPDFKPENFVRPMQVKHSNFVYTLFIYTKPISADKFKTLDGQIIENAPGWLFSMLIAGINNKPDYYVVSSLDEFNNEEISICKLDNKTYDQIKYTNLTESGNIVKQMTFNNGEFSIGSICNPKYVPGNDI